ncbi:MAG TPA: ABC transporter substrate-binding protein [Burkholderiaceae bacterium]|nr:ABC transporter substrate-binding protein [Burkholderiaceae bacterium]
MTTSDRTRRRVLQVSLAGASMAALPAAARARTARAQTSEKVIRYAFPIAETGFDPAQIVDIYSRYVTAHIFESLLIYDFLARPVRLKPLAAAAMPEISADFRTYSFRVRPGILFHDDPAFNGRRRELTAHDFVFTFKRFWDPRSKSPIFSSLEEYKVLGMNALRQRVLEEKSAFPYDTEVEGIRALDRYTFRMTLADTAPHFIETFATTDLFGAVAREVVEKYGDDIMAHPVGTGPFRLAQWKRSSRIVLERNPHYRELPFHAEAPAEDTLAQRFAENMRGRKLPLVDRVEIYVIEEPQPRWLAFLNGEHDLMERLPADFINIAAPGGKLAPNLARRGIGIHRTLGADVTYTAFNMKDPVIGGYTPEKTALRRAISLALNVEEEIRIPRRGQAVQAHSPINPHTYGHDPDLRSEMGTYDLARAKALLDLYGYVDRDGDGWRELPDGSPLVIEHLTVPEQGQRQLDEIRKKNMDALGVRLQLKYGRWPEHLKAARAARFMSWGVASMAASYDSRPALQRCHGPASGGQNISHFDHPEFNRVYDALRVEPNGPRRLELIAQATKIWIAYMPYKVHVSRIFTDLWQPWVNGFLRHPFMLRFWEYLDVDNELRRRGD